VSDPWTLDDPSGALDLWIELDKPDDNLRNLVTVWLVSFDDPYVGDYDPVNPAAWSAVAAKIPPGVPFPSQCVLVAYRISPSERRITVDFISTMSWPA
jgi:hypothetical protein